MWSYIMFILDSPKYWAKAEKREDNKVYMETILDLLQELLLSF